MDKVFNRAERYINELERIILLSVLFLFFWLVFFYVHEVSGAEKGAPGGAERRQSQEMDEEIGPLTEKDGETLISVARHTIAGRLFSLDDPEDAALQQSDKFSKRRGTFVTLTINGNLRGCIGHIIPQETILEGVKINAINAAFKDPRFRPLSRPEWDDVKIEVSILTEPRTLDYQSADDLLEKLRPGIDGVIIKKGHAQATFLPQVWEQLPMKKDFLSHLCMKAGMDGNAWKKAGLEVSVYQVQAFQEGE
jgi:AmmeMemoRadiSam system protein A